MTTIEQNINQGELQEEDNTAHTPESVEYRKLLSPCNIDVEDTSHLADLPGDRFLACGYLACILKRTSGKSVTDLSVLEQLR